MYKLTISDDAVFHINDKDTVEKLLSNDVTIEGNYSYYTPKDDEQLSITKDKMFNTFESTFTMDKEADYIYGFGCDGKASLYIDGSIVTTVDGGQKHSSILLPPGVHTIQVKNLNTTLGNSNIILNANVTDYTYNDQPGWFRCMYSAHSNWDNLDLDDEGYPSKDALNSICDTIVGDLTVDYDIYYEKAIDSIPTYEKLKHIHISSVGTKYESTSRTIDLSNCPELISVSFNSIDATDINMSPTMNPNVVDFTGVNVKKITSVNMVKYDDVSRIYADGLTLTALSVGVADEITILNCAELRYLNIESVEHLTKLVLDTCDIPTIDIHTIIQRLTMESKVRYGYLSLTNVGNITDHDTLSLINILRYREWVVVYHNQDGDVIKTDTTINVPDTDISTLNLSTYGNILELDCSNNNLTEINLVPAPNAVNVDVSNNVITTIQVDPSNRMRELDISNNKLTYIPTQSMTKLTKLHVANNKLNHLDINNLSSLISIDASNNELSSNKIDEMLSALLDSYKWEGNLNLLNNAPPTPRGVQMIELLVSRGWVVKYDMVVT